MGLIDRGTQLDIDEAMRCIERLKDIANKYGLREANIAYNYMQEFEENLQHAIAEEDEKLEAKHG